jgi:hypothetical protein
MTVEQADAALDWLDDYKKTLDEQAERLKRKR